VPGFSTTIKIEATRGFLHTLLSHGAMQVGGGSVSVALLRAEPCRYVVVGVFGTMQVPMCTVYRVLNVWFHLLASRRFPQYTGRLEQQHHHVQYNAEQPAAFGVGRRARLF
jgi:urea transporter